MQDLWEYLKTAKKPIVLYGTGNGADKTVARLNADGVKISGVFSSEGFKKNKTFAGHQVTDYISLKQKFNEMIILCCFGSHLPEVLDNIKKLATENELYAPDVPVFGDEIFDLKFAKSHYCELKTVYDMLADDFSKKVFENTIYFKMTGKIDYLLEVESARNEVYSLLSLGQNEDFLDLGAFTGDTVDEFIGNVKDYNSIVAVEPDGRNYRKLTENTAKYYNVRCLNAAATDKVGEFFITANHGRGNSSVGKLKTVDGVTIDYLSNIIKPTFIKMDVEGNELAAILGGKNTISNLRPKMHIACYHTPFDLFKIPLVIKEFIPNYKLYMRHHPCIPAWDINYIFI